MDLNRPDVVAEVQAAFDAYEAALMANDIAGLDAAFWDSPHTIRYGVNEVLHGIAAIRAFRAGRPTLGLLRSLEHTVITTFGRDLATASTTYRRDSAPGRLGRQQQTWVRLPEGWRVVAAHVSVMDDE
ncbi:MAG: oxalurate catabolism protein HpxZ [Gemmatimonadaceae bacterium]|nr:oxalurate catabolism protein HpxZ [Acetobacteraceae bacterium]